MGTGAALMSLGSLIKQQGDVRRARDLLAEGLRLCNQVGAKLPIPSVLEEFGELAAEGQQRDSDIRAVQL